mgnify:FL=1
MKGSPLIRAILTLGVLLLFGIPVRRVMRAGTEEGDPEPGRVGLAMRPEGAARSVAQADRLEVESTAEVKLVVVKHLGAEILRLEGGARSGGAVLAVTSGEGMDLMVEVEWRVKGVAAVRFRRVPGDGAASVDRFVWGNGDGPVEEVLAFPEG